MFSMCGGVHGRHMSSAESCCGGDKMRSLSIQRTHIHFFIAYSNVWKDMAVGWWLIQKLEPWHLIYDDRQVFYCCMWDSHTHLPQMGHYRCICPWVFCVQPILSIRIHHNRKWLVKPPERKRTEMKQCPWHAKFLNKTSYAALPPVVAFSVKEGFGIAVQVHRGVFPHHAFFLII